MDGVPYVITEACIGLKDASCVAVCPVDCIHPGPEEEGFAETDQLYIDPSVCIDCGACEPECPVNAIYPDTAVPEELASYIQKNADYFKSKT
jgi:NAD-dependent dihydropyrimidine dehydrogenase PreA subunit